MSDPYRITTIEQLEARLGKPKATTPLKLVQTLGAIERRFIAASPMVVIATADREGGVTVSPKGDSPGFVEVLDERTLLVPDRPGNKLAFGLRNLLENPKIALMFFVPGTGETLRVEGSAELTEDPALLERMSARGKPATLVLRVQVRRCYLHCKKAFLRSGLWQPQSWQPVEFNWGDWATERFAVDQAAAAGVNAEIAEDEKLNL
jgi:hypothetical protein